MANSMIDWPVNGAGHPNKGVTQRGQHALRAYKLVMTTTGSGYLYPILDSLDLGGVCFSAFISNLTANGAGTGLKFTPQISHDGETWTNVAWKDEVGSATASGEVTLAQNATQWVIVNFASYPEAACARYFRLKVHPSTSATSIAYITMMVK